MIENQDRALDAYALLTHAEAAALLPPRVAGTRHLHPSFRARTPSSAALSQQWGERRAVRPLSLFPYPPRRRAEA